MKNLLIATDFSANAKHAAEYGYQLAVKLNTNIVLCNSFIVPAEMPDAGFVSWPMYEYEELTKDSENELKRLKASLEEKHDVTEFKPTIECVNGVGTVTDLIGALVDKKQVRLIIIGTHGVNGLSQFLIGNHSRRIIEETTIPLLLVPISTKIGPIKKIVFATDLKETHNDLGNIYELIKIIGPLNAELQITHIVDEKIDSSEVKSLIQSFQAELSRNVSYPHIDFKTVQSATTEKGLEWLCEHDHVDILTMVHREHSFFERIFKGSHTQKIAEKINIPLLVMPSNSNQD